VVALVAAAAWVLVEDAGALVEDAVAAKKSKVSDACFRRK